MYRRGYSAAANPRMSFSRKLLLSAGLLQGLAVGYIVYANYRSSMFPAPSASDPPSSWLNRQLRRELPFELLIKEKTGLFLQYVNDKWSEYIRSTQQAATSDDKVVPLNLNVKHMAAIAANQSPVMKDPEISSLKPVQPDVKLPSYPELLDYEGLPSQDEVFAEIERSLADQKTKLLAEYEESLQRTLSQELHAQREEIERFWREKMSLILETELTAQKNLLIEEWQDNLQKMLDNERQGRLANLKGLAEKVQALEGLYQEKEIDWKVSFLLGKLSKLTNSLLTVLNVEPQISIADEELAIAYAKEEVGRLKAESVEAPNASNALSESLYDAKLNELWSQKLHQQQELIYKNCVELYRTILTMRTFITETESLTAPDDHQKLQQRKKLLEWLDPFKGSYTFLFQILKSLPNCNQYLDAAVKKEERKGETQGQPLSFESSLIIPSVTSLRQQYERLKPHLLSTSYIQNSYAPFISHFISGVFYRFLTFRTVPSVENVQFFPSRSKDFSAADVLDDDATCAVGPTLSSGKLVPGKSLASILNRVDYWFSHPTISNADINISSAANFVSPLAFYRVDMDLIIRELTSITNYWPSLLLSDYLAKARAREELLMGLSILKTHLDFVSIQYSKDSY